MVKRPLWPIVIMWRWRERDYRKRYGTWTHGAANKKNPIAWILQLGPICIRFGDGRSNKSFL